MDNSLKELVEVFTRAKDKALLEDLLLGLTTAHEREALAKRIEIIKRLKAGEQQHAIASDLQVGVSTVTRGSKELAEGHFKVLA